MTNICLCIPSYVYQNSSQDKLTLASVARVKTQQSFSEFKRVITMHVEQVLEGKIKQNRSEQTSYRQVSFRRRPVTR